MAQSVLLNTVRVGSAYHYAGETIDTAQMSATEIANIVSAGGVLYPLAASQGDQSLLVLQSAAQLLKKQAADPAMFDALMLAAPGMQMLKKEELSIALADITGKGAVMSGTFDFANAFPANAILDGGFAEITAAVDNAGLTATTTIDIGTDAAGASDWAAKTVSVKTTGSRYSGGTNGRGKIGGAKGRVTMTSSVNLSTIATGALKVTMFYRVFQ